MMNIEKAVHEFMDSNMVILTGSGSISVGIYENDIPDNREATGVRLSVFNRVPDEDVPELEYCSIQFIVFAPDEGAMYTFCQNVDTLFKQLLKINLNDEVEALYMDRLTGPSPWIGAFDTNSYAVMTFRLDARERTSG